MKVLMITEWSPCGYGGVASQVSLLSNWLMDKGFEVTIAYKQGTCQSDRRFVKVGGIIPLEVHVVPPVFWRVKAIIEEVSPDVVHVHHSFTPFSVLAVRACNKLGLPCVLTNHSLPPIGDPSSWTRYLQLNPYRVLLKPTIVTAVSKSAGEFIKRFLGGNVRLRIIPNAVDPKRFKPGGFTRKNYILYVGRLVRRKGVHVLIDAFRILRSRGIDARLLIAGQGYLEKFLKIKASRIEGVRFLGEISEDEKAELFSKAYVSVLPSLVGESFGVVILESFASGTPVVASRVGGIPEVVEDRKNGLLVNPGDVIGLADSLEALFIDKKLWLKLSENSLKTCLEKFSIERVGTLYEKVYEEALIAASIERLVKTSVSWRILA